MRTRTPIAAVTCAMFFAVALLLGCGGNAGPVSSPTPPSSPAPVPAPPSGSGGGSGSGGSSGGGSGGSSSGSPSASTAWSSTVTGGSGTVTVSTTGDVAVQVTGAKASTTFAGFFCQWPSSYLYHTGREGCFALNQSLVTDASGNAKLTFHFPKSGIWEGAFYFDPNGNTSYSPDQITTDVSDDDAKTNVSAPLLPVSKMNPPNTGDPYIPSNSPQESGSGTVTVSGAKVTVNFTGGMPNTKYDVATDFSYGGSAGGDVATFTTDASGNANVTLPPRPGSGTLITVGIASAQQQFGVAAAFNVP